MQNSITVLFFLRRIGPYHNARFEAFAKTNTLITVETRPMSKEYPWEFQPQFQYINEKFPISNDIEIGLRGEELKNAIEFLVNKYNPSVIVTTGWADPEYHRVVLIARNRKIPLVVISDSRYEDEPRKFYKEWIKRAILNAYSSALVAGTSSRNYLVKLGFNNDKIFQPWDVVDNDYFASKVVEGIAHLDKYFLCVSRFIKKKNIPTLIDAFKAYRNQGGKRKLVLLGSGEMEVEIRSYIEKWNLTNDVLIEGFVQYNALPSYFAKALSLILPSVTDQWGLVVNEAMAAGLPLLVSNGCGCAIDLVEHDKNGFIFSPDSVNQISTCLISIDTLSFERWRTMADLSKRKIKSWSIDEFSNGLNAACQEAIPKPSKTIFKLLHLILSK